MGAAEVEAPMIDHTRSEFPLFGNRMHDEDTAHVVGASRARDIVNVEAGDRRSDALGVAIDDRVMDQRYEEVIHLEFARSELATGCEVGPPPRGAPLRFGRAPFANLAVIAAEQNLWHAHPAEFLGP